MSVLGSAGPSKIWSKTGKGKPGEKRELELYPDEHGNRRQRLAYRSKKRKNGNGQGSQTCF